MVKVGVGWADERKPSGRGKVFRWASSLAQPTVLGAFVKDRGWEVSLKTQEDPQDAEVRRKKDLVLFYFALFVVTVLIGVALTFIFGPESSPEDKKWGLTFIASLGSALVGYLVGKKSQ